MTKTERELLLLVAKVLREPVNSGVADAQRSLLRDLSIQIALDSMESA